MVEVIRLMDKFFGMNNYSLIDLFRDEQRRILSMVTAETEKELEYTFRLTYEKNQPLMALLLQTGMPVPKAFLSAAEFSLNVRIRNALREESIDEAAIRAGFDEMRKWGLSPDAAGLEFMLRRRLESMMAALMKVPSDTSLLAALARFLGLLRTLPFEVNLWQTQNNYFGIAKTAYGEFLSKARAGDREAAEWIEAFRNVGELLSFCIPSVLPEG
jgi:hypothetical protein